nr:hypothetical protein [Tanacetum cinerariifolium]
GSLDEATTSDYPFLNNIIDHSISPFSAFVKLKPDRFPHQITVLAPRVVGVSLPATKVSTMTPAPSLVELFLKDASPLFAAAALEKNEEWLSAMVDTTNEEMVGAAFDNSVHGIVYQLCHEMNRVESSSI